MPQYPGRMRPFDLEISLPKPVVSRPRIDETYGMLQLAIRFLALLADFAGIGVFVYVGVVWGYVNHFATAAAAWALVPDLAETIALCNTSRRIKRIPVALIMVMDVVALGLLGGSWFWYLYGQAKNEREFGDELLDEEEREFRTGCLIVSFILFGLHVLNLAICWVDLCRRGH